MLYIPKVFIYQLKASASITFCQCIFILIKCNRSSFFPQPFQYLPRMSTTSKSHVHIKLHRAFIWVHSTDSFNNLDYDMSSCDRLPLLSSAKTCKSSAVSPIPFHKLILIPDLINIDAELSTTSLAIPATSTNFFWNQQTYLWHLFHYLYSCQENNSYEIVGFFS